MEGDRSWDQIFEVLGSKESLDSLKILYSEKPGQLPANGEMVATFLEQSYVTRFTLQNCGFDMEAIIKIVSGLALRPENNRNPIIALTLQRCMPDELEDDNQSERLGRAIAESGLEDFFMDNLGTNSLKSIVELLPANNNLKSLWLQVVPMNDEESYIRPLLESMEATYGLNDLRVDQTAKSTSAALRQVGIQAQLIGVRNTAFAQYKETPEEDQTPAALISIAGSIVEEMKTNKKYRFRPRLTSDRIDLSLIYLLLKLDPKALARCLIPRMETGSMMSDLD